MKRTYASFSARKDLESGFHLCVYLVEFVRASFTARKDLESGFYECGGTVKLVRASFTDMIDLEAVVTTVEDL